jgi:aminoglycoside phosphotransferase (APT) family kinase protein
MARSLGATPRGAQEIVGLGAVNHVVVVETGDGDWVIRFHRDPLDADDYRKEAWCLQSAAEAGVNTPRMVALGRLNGIAFIVQTFVEGHNADGRRSPELWRRLGEFSRKVNEIELSEDAPDALFPRFGRDLVENWRKHIAYNLAELHSCDELLRLGAYEPGDQDLLKACFERLEGRINHFGFTHGDLVPKNALIGRTGEVVILDWGSAFTGPIPFADYQRIWADDAGEGFTRADLDAFAEGYGVPFSSLEDDLRDLQLLNRIDVVRWAIDHRPDRIPELVSRARAAVRASFRPRSA